MAAPWRDIGPTEVSWGGVVIGKTQTNPSGGTQGGTRVRITTEVADSFRDHSGVQKHDSIVTGTMVEVEANFAGLDVDQMATLLPGATVQNMGGGEKKLDIKSAVGLSLRDNAQELILKPLDDGIPTTDETQWIHFPQAHPRPNVDFAFNLQDQKIFAVMFDVFTDLTTDVIMSVGQQST